MNLNEQTRLQLVVVAVVTEVVAAAAASVVVAACSILFWLHNFLMLTNGI